MTYCLLRQDAREEHWMALSVAGVTAGALRSGMLIEQLEEPVRITLSAWGRLASDFLEHPCFVVSDAMRRALEGAGVDNIQYFRAELQMELSERTISGYWLGNVLGLLSCVDHDASTFEPSGGHEHGALRAFSIDPARSYDLGLFRLAEDTRVVVVNSRVRAALQAAKLRGLVLQDTRTYDGYSARTGPVVADSDEPDEDDR